MSIMWGLLLLHVGDALAAAQVICVERYDPLHLAVAVGQATDAMADRDTGQARTRLDDAVRRMPCLTEVVGRRLFAQFARVRAQVAFVEGDVDGAQGWGVAGRLADPELEWSYVFPDNHPFRLLLTHASVPDVVSVGHAGLAPPPGGGVFVNGALLERAELRPGVPALIQVFDDQQVPVDGWWQRAGLLPSAILADGPHAVSPPLWWKGSGPTSAWYRPSGWEDVEMVPWDARDAPSRRPGARR